MLLLAVLPVQGCEVAQGSPEHPQPQKSAPNWPKALGVEGIIASPAGMSASPSN